MKADLTGKVALVTGASSGFGYRFAKVLAANGAHVHVAARRADRLTELVAEIIREGGSATAVQLEVSVETGVSAAIAGIGVLDIVVNNAGVAGASRALDCGEAEWRWTYDVNVHGAWFVARHAARSMVAQGRPGTIINIASITAERPGAVATAYSSSKAAVIQMTKAAAMEWARYGIRVNAIAPGYFETDLNRPLLQSKYGEAMRSRIPQRRFGEFADLDGPLLLLASPASAYMTGSVIVVDGGHLCAAL
jgi:NAD(P)-dependent dehydrogenase (short-subunit alcohol dehydrogenase family)